MFGLRVDVDTLWGLQRGVKNLLDLFDEVKVKATFFIPFGADETGRAVKRIFAERGFLKRMFRLRGIYSTKSVLHGTLLHSPRMGESHPEVLLEIKRRGHEIGIHGYNHGHWRDDLLRMGEREIGEELHRASSGFQNVFKKTPHSTAAPGWRCTDGTLRIQEKFSFKYASDTRGTSPFYPIIQIPNFKSPITNFQTLKTLQLPVTIPTLDELIPLGAEGKLLEIPLAPLPTGRQALLKGEHKGSFLKGSKRNDFSSFQLYCAHAEVEGASKISLFRNFLLRILEKGAISDMTLETIAETYLEGSEEIPKNQVRWKRIPGRTMKVKCQLNG
jgi:peptidoglycan/xylan/chitin deacetylase (PgdA/CDA1 family)